MRHADQMHKCAFQGNVRVVSAADCAAKNGMASWWKFGYGRYAGKGADFMAARKQYRASRLPM